ncbi:MAG: aspartate carbamoyltransferase, partial [Lachnospiraceae bacterium]|nr:aspartate carbamoyltransferase [Lachnospiraceae bacterium]
MGLQSKDLLGLKQLTADEIMEILDTAKMMKMVLTSGNKKTSHLQGKSVVTLFYENSTRTRLSFELASKYMGSASANISTSGSSVNKGESLLDTARTIDMMATDIIIMRHSQSGAPHYLAPRV